MLLGIDSINTPWSTVVQTEARSIRGLAEGLAGGRSDGRHEKIMVPLK